MSANANETENEAAKKALPDLYPQPLPERESGLEASARLQNHIHALVMHLREKYKEDPQLMEMCDWLSLLHGWTTGTWVREIGDRDKVVQELYRTLPPMESLKNEHE